MSKKTNEPNESELSDEKCPLCGRFLLKPTLNEAQQRPRFMCDRCELESILEFPILTEKIKKENTKRELKKVLKKWDKEYQEALERKLSKQDVQ